jgi:hypothetical protein
VTMLCKIYEEHFPLGYDAVYSGRSSDKLLLSSSLLSLSAQPNVPLQVLPSCFSFPFLRLRFLRKKTHIPPKRLYKRARIFTLLRR